jgi:hypothetical protein
LVITKAESSLTLLTKITEKQMITMCPVCLSFGIE